MQKDIIYYLHINGNTCLYRFYDNGQVLRCTFGGNQPFEHREKVPGLLVEGGPGVYKGEFRFNKNKIGFDVEIENEVQVYIGELLKSGDLQLTLYKVRSKQKGPVVLKPFDDTVRFNWKNSKYNKQPAGPLDLRLSTYEQLQHKLGEDNVFLIAYEFLNESETPIVTFLNDFLYAARKEIAKAQLIIDNSWKIKTGNKVYDLNIGNFEQYVNKMQIVKDLNGILEAQGSSKRIFYFDDFTDNDANPSYFYAKKDLGLQMIEFLNDPPFYSYLEFKNTSCNRIINMQYVDSSTEIKAAYYKQLIPDF